VLVQDTGQPGDAIGEVSIGETPAVAAYDLGLGLGLERALQDLSDDQRIAVGRRSGREVRGLHGKSKWDAGAAGAPAVWGQ
jgi:hypothetical protein